MLHISDSSIYATQIVFWTTYTYSGTENSKSEEEEQLRIADEKVGILSFYSSFFVFLCVCACMYVCMREHVYTYLHCVFVYVVFVRTYVCMYAVFPVLTCNPVVCLCVRTYICT